ncbi:MAG: heme-copper oxidase subunit III [Chloroflexi bacterium]|nr:heme-copper oxidase subunit III [Chloroflexota bacterium]
MASGPAVATGNVTGHGSELAARKRRSLNRIGLWLFLLSETFLFSALLSSRFFLMGLSRPEELDQALGLGITMVLILSSLTAFRAETFAFHGKQKEFSQNMIFTLILGLIFMLGVGYEWSQAFDHFPPSTGYGTLFFTLTGVHAFHVATGIIALAVVTWIRRGGRGAGGHTWPVAGVVKYWHFVDVAWVFIYPALYLVN